MLRLVATMFLIVGISGCQTFAPVESLQTIELGMTKTQVSKLTGSPTHRHLEADQEAWGYCVNGWLVDDYMLVWFDGDRVVGKELLNDYEFGRCRARDESFDWNQAPSS